jgi:hypothetical protein
MTRLFLVFFSWFSVFFRSRHDLGLKLAALRHQFAVLKRKNPRPPVEPVGSPVLANPPAPVAKMVERPADRKAEVGRPLTLRWLSVVLTLPSSPPLRSAENHLRTAETHPLYGSGESDVGSAQDPRRALEIGVRSL